MIDRYDSIANLQHFHHPICVIRGDKDDHHLSGAQLNLFAHLPDPKKMILMSGYGHGDWPDSDDLPGGTRRSTSSRRRNSAYLGGAGLTVVLVTPMRASSCWLNCRVGTV